MKNDSATIPSSKGDIEVLYCGNISSDDFVWSVGCQVRDVISLLEAPQEWVKSLRSLPGWSPASYGYVTTPEAPRLNRHFTIQISKSDFGAGTAQPVHIHGIDETGIIKAIISKQAAKDALRLLLQEVEKLPSHQSSIFGPLRESFENGDPRQDYWKLLRYVFATNNSGLDLINDPDSGSWFGHVRIYNLHWEIVGPFRHLWLACYLLMRTINPKGYVEDFLNRLHRSPSPDPNAVSVQDQPQLKITSARKAAFVYASAENTSDEMCDAIFGVNDPNDNGQGGLTSATTKNYRSADPGSSSSSPAVSTGLRKKW